MKILFKLLLPQIFPCFYPINENSSTLRVQEAIVMNRLDQPAFGRSSIHNLISTTQPPKTDSSIFINIRPETYNSMKEDFISHHHSNTTKLSELILEEQDVADRIYNIHTITGNNVSPNLLNNLKRTFSQEFDVSSIIADVGHLPSAQHPHLSPALNMSDTQALEIITTVVEKGLN
jgi:hypothetical protein